MLNLSSFFSSISSLWSELFEDKELLKAIYSSLATKISDSFSRIMELPANLSLVNTPTFEVVTGAPVYIDTSTRYHIDLDSERSITVFGIPISLDTAVKNAPRLYTSSSFDTEDYYENIYDYAFYSNDSNFILDLKANTEKSRYFSRYSSFIVFFDLDPSIQAVTVTNQDASGSLYYITGSIDADDSTAGILSTTKTLNIEVSGVVSRIVLAGCENQYANRWRLQLPIEEHVLESEIDSVFIISDTGSRIRVAFDSPVLELNTTLALYSPRLTRWSNAIPDRFFHILSSDVELPSSYILPNTESLKNKILAVQRAKLLETDYKLIQSVIAAFCDIPLLLQSSSIDQITSVDNLQFKVTAGIRKLSLVPGFPLNPEFIEALREFPQGLVSVSRTDCKKLHISFATAAQLTVSIGYPLPESYSNPILITDINGTFTCNLVLVSSEFIAVTLTNGSFPEAITSLVCRLSNGSNLNEVIEVTGISSFSNQEIPLDAFSPIQHAALAYDISRGTNWWQQAEVYVPDSLWNNGKRRNNLLFGSWRPIVGNVKEHTVGDYGITIGATSFKSTTWNLFRDIYVRNTCFVTTSPFLSTVAKDAVAYCNNLVNLGTALLTDSSLGFVEVAPVPTETLSLVTLQPVAKDQLTDSVIVFSDTGIGSASVILVGKIDLPSLDEIPSTYSLIISDTALSSSDVEYLNFVNGLFVFSILAEHWVLGTYLVPTIATLQLSPTINLPIKELTVYNIVGSSVPVSVVGCELPLTPPESTGNLGQAFVTDYLDIQEF